jgi:hypothetical protein
MFLAVLLVLFLLAFILVVLLLFLLLRRRDRVPPPQPCPPTYKVPDAFTPAELPAVLAVRLTGTPANGVAATGANATAKSVVWVNGGSEVLVHLDSTQVRILDGMLLVSVDLETDQTGRSPLVCTYALNNSGNAAGLFATTEDYPRGDALLVSCWGQQLQQAIWSSLLSLANDHAAERSLAPRALIATAGSLRLAAGAPVVVAPVAKGTA